MTVKHRIDAWGRTLIGEDELVELLYNEQFDFENAVGDGSPTVLQFNDWCRVFNAPDAAVPTTEIDIDPVEYHAQRQSEWLIPEEYQRIDVEAYVLPRCADQQERDRVVEELALFEKHSLLPILRLMIYLVDTMRANNVVWGVGRGSSVASFVLYLIGVHRIHSIRYGLNITEFIRD